MLHLTSLNLLPLHTCRALVQPELATSAQLPLLHGAGCYAAAIYVSFQVSLGVRMFCVPHSCVCRHHNSSTELLSGFVFG